MNFMHRHSMYDTFYGIKPYRNYESSKKRNILITGICSAALLYIAWIGLNSQENKESTSYNLSIKGAQALSADQIDHILKENNSPAVGTGKVFYQKGLEYGVNDAYALAFFDRESGMGKSGVATETKSIGNIRCTPGYKCLTTRGNGSFRKYDTWEDGIEDFYKLIHVDYFGRRKLITVDQILPVYAPEADKNNPTAYADYVKNKVKEWQKEKQSVPSTVSVIVSDFGLARN